MDERERVIRICRDLALPASQYVINGSGSMIMHGITAEERGKEMGDLDIFCATRVWFELLAKARPMIPRRISWSLFTTDPSDVKRRVDPAYLYADVHGLEVNIFSEWRRRPRGNFDVGFYIANAVKIDGIPCAPLQFIYDWKATTGRAKDQIDMEVLKTRPEVTPEVVRD